MRTCAGKTCLHSHCERMVPCTTLAELEEIKGRGMMQSKVWGHRKYGVSNGDKTILPPSKLSIGPVPGELTATVCCGDC